MRQLYARITGEHTIASWYIYCEDDIGDTRYLGQVMFQNKRDDYSWSTSKGVGFVLTRNFAALHCAQSHGIHDAEVPRLWPDHFDASTKLTGTAWDYSG